MAKPTIRIRQYKSSDHTDVCKLFTDGLNKEQIFLLQEHNIIYTNNYLPVYENSHQVLDLFREK